MFSDLKQIVADADFIKISDLQCWRKEARKHKEKLT